MAPAHEKGLSDLRNPAEWAAFFAFHEGVVLCANSDAVDVDDLERRHPEGTLFVFFNKTYKILHRSFERPSLLLARSGRAGANIVYRREVERVIQPLVGAQFHGICNLKAGESERLSPAPEFGGATVGHLDLTSSLRDFYPRTHVATSGFALALFLAESCPQLPLELAGFTARRSRQWKLFTDHDWTFEQIVLRLLEARGRLSRTEESDDATRRISQRFGDVKTEEVALVAAEVLGERLESAHSAIDRLFSIVRPLDRGTELLKRLKPKTRKQRLLEKETRGKAGEV